MRGYGGGRRGRARRVAGLVLAGIVLSGVLAAAAPVRVDRTASEPRTAGSRTNVVGGEPVPVDDYPWAVHLTTRNGVVFCAGALVAADRVVTAAHCLLGASADRVRVVVGRTDSGGAEGQSLPVDGLWVHPEFTTAVRGDDVGLLRLATPVDRATIAVAGPSDTDPYRPGTAAEVVGWGAEEEGGLPGGPLRRVVVTTLSAEDCARSHPEVDGDRMVCAEDAAGRAGFCQGDSGAPLVAEGLLVGLASFSAGCASEDPGVHTRLSHHRDTLEGVDDWSRAVAGTPGA
ncbi:serine protease [Actinoalloteichus sp. AHMU CJ021]|uniref:Trypsin n=1 Tax=Actinoalloteichus caeruleus DSM 43889 TaxID=1120930 RepID=A0ABT1JRW7_ACTCY|nr:serine protease [Actinoalloteichus caeruleus]AUS80166.1 serine protease [Actinoalloteichus sp. AHMU CJ021]MCP2334391.1 Trypsin [Actinoalloteichus caeruleus DSM 43889]